MFIDRGPFQGWVLKIVTASWLPQGASGVRLPRLSSSAVSASLDDNTSLRQDMYFCHTQVVLGNTHVHLVTFRWCQLNSSSLCPQPPRQHWVSSNLVLITPGHVIHDLDLCLRTWVTCLLSGDTVFLSLSLLSRDEVFSLIARAEPGCLYAKCTFCTL